MDNNLYKAPIGEKPQRVLDLCTGTGVWAIEFGMILFPCDTFCELECTNIFEADEFPSAEVLAVEIRKAALNIH